jgi:hypothetical protein
MTACSSRSSFDPLKQDLSYTQVMLLGLIVIAAAQSSWPPTLTAEVGGLSLVSELPAYVCHFDKASRFFVYHTNDCDGSHRSLRLTRDRRMIASAGYNAQPCGGPASDSFDKTIETRPFHLGTGHGINIGMSRRELVKKLGQPEKTAVRGPSRSSGARSTSRCGETVARAQSSAIPISSRMGSSSRLASILMEFRGAAGIASRTRGGRGRRFELDPRP